MPLENKKLFYAICNKVNRRKVLIYKSEVCKYVITLYLVHYSSQTWKLRIFYQKLVIKKTAKIEVTDLNLILIIWAKEIAVRETDTVSSADSWKLIDKF